LLKLSVSSMDTHEKCPKKYHYRYIEKPDLPKQEWNFTALGSCAHRILEIFHERIIKECTPEKDYSILMKQCFKAGVKEFDINLLQDFTWMPEGDMSGMLALRIMMQDYLNKIRAEGTPDVIGIELKYSFHINPTTIVRGFIDRVDRVSPGVYRVVDYKTSKNQKYLTEFQLKVYAEALNRVYKDVKVVYGSYLLLKHKCVTKDYTFNHDDLKDCVALVTKKASNIENDKNWIKKPSILCRWCDYMPICQDAWAE